MNSRIMRIHAALTEAFAPTDLNVVDDSAAHAGHPGARDGRGHFRIQIVGGVPSGTRMEQHRMVYAALGDMMETDIHALSVQVTDS